MSFKRSIFYKTKKSGYETGFINLHTLRVRVGGGGS